MEKSVEKITTKWKKSGKTAEKSGNPEKAGATFGRNVSSMV